MAINVTFNGSTIFKPGAYSKVEIDLGGGFPLSPAGIMAIIGEADRGRPASEEAEIKNNVFSPEQIPEIREKYGTGTLVDAAAFAFSPATDGAIPSGAQALYIIKTNQSDQASLDLAATYGTVRSREFGVGGNRVTYKNVLVAETPASEASSVSFDEVASLSAGNAFDLSINGGAQNTFTFPGGITSNADLASQLADGGNWSGGLPTGITITVSGSDGASIVTFTQDTLTTAHQLGWGRSFELAESSGTPLASMNLTAALIVPAVEPSATITLRQTRDLISEEESLGGNIIISAGVETSNGATAATIEVDDTDVILTITGGTDAGTVTLPKSSFAILADLVEAINLAAGWSAQIESALYNQLSPDVIDEVPAIGALSDSTINARPARLKKDAQDVQDFFEESGIAELIGTDPANVSETGLPDNLTETSLTGGTVGATSSANITDGLEQLTKVRVNFIVPLFSRDATDDIADSLTDSSSSYTIASIHQSVKTHLSLMATTKRRSERQAVLAIKESFDDSLTTAATIADFRSQLVIQDVRQVDSLGSIKFFQPHMLAVLLAGARSGSPVGTPMTNKFLNASGIRHTAQPISTAEEDIVQDFDPDTQFDEAIQGAITFLEAPQTGGFRVVVDNTTYNRDNNFVRNRANVQYAADILAFDLRAQLEAIFVGVKNVLNAVEVKSVVESIMATFLAQGITVSTDDAPNGFKELTVKIEGNIIRVSLVAKLVEGIDFILTEITVQRATSEA
jgi:hypothetical protein